MLLYTGQRRGDVVKLGRQHVESEMFRLRQRKTGNKLLLPILPQLQEVMDATPPGGLAFIVNKLGNPFTPAGFGNAFRVWCDQANLPHCTAHGLRKAGATIAAENGATDRELMAIFGWKNAEMATLYTAQAEQKKLATAGMGKLVSRTDGDQSAVPAFFTGTSRAKKLSKIKR